MSPKLTYHIGCSADGRTDWLEPDNFLYYRLIINDKFDAMMSGSSTMLKAEMSTEEKIKKMSDQYLVVVDSKGLVKNWDVIKRQAWWNDRPIVLCSETTPKDYLSYLDSEKIQYLIEGNDNVDLGPALERLESGFSIKTIRIDSGGILGGALLRAGLVNEISILYSPQLTGGESAKSIFRAPDAKSFEEIIDLELIKSEVVERNYVWTRYKVKTCRV